MLDRIGQFEVAFRVALEVFDRRHVCSGGIHDRFSPFWVAFRVAKVVYRLSVHDYCRPELSEYFRLCLLFLCARGNMTIPEITGHNRT